MDVSSGFLKQTKKQVAVMLTVKLSFSNGPLAGRRMAFSETVVIGRGTENDIVLADPSVSTSHGRLVFKTDRVFVEDLDSANGTRLNGKVVKSAELHDGDRLVLGDVEMTIQLAEEAAAPAAPPAATAPERPAVPPPPNPPVAPAARTRGGYG